MALIVSYLLFVILPQTWEVRRILSGRYLKVKTEQKGSLWNRHCQRVLDYPTVGFQKVTQCSKRV
jgi:hypothetical protein